MKDRQAQPYKMNTNIYPRKTLKGKTQQKLPQDRCLKKVKPTRRSNPDPPPSPTTLLFSTNVLHK